MRFFCLAVFLTLVSVSFCIICETCDGDSCLDSQRWVLETCPPPTKFCYRFTNEDKVFRRGCAAYDCVNMPAVPEGATCNTCDSDRCNGVREQLDLGPGGGGIWINSSTSFLPILPIFWVIYSYFL